MSFIFDLQKSINRYKNVEDLNPFLKELDLTRDFLNERLKRCNNDVEKSGIIKKIGIVDETYSMVVRKKFN